MKSDTLVRLGFVSLLALAPASFGVTAHDGFDPGKSPIVRPEGIWDISKYVYLLSALFHRPVSTIERQYSKELPQALDAVVKTKDESRVADVLGELFTTVSEEQKKLILKEAERLRLIKENEEKTDSEAIALLDRLIWGAKGLLKQEIDKNEKNIGFLKAFFGDPNGTPEAKKGSFQANLDAKQDVLNAIKTANDPNTNETTRKEAKKFLRKTLSRDAVMAYIEGQMASGNKEAALDLASAVAWVDPKSGEKFLEFFNGTGAERLYLGKDRASMESALDKYAARKGGLHTATLAQDEHEKIAPTEYVSTHDGLVEGRPQGASTPKAIRSSGAPTASRRKTETVSSIAPAPSTPAARGNVAQAPKPIARSKPNSGNNRASNGAALFSANCTASCHMSWPKDPGAMKRAISGNTMPPQDFKKLTEGEKQALIAFINSGGGK